MPPRPRGPSRIGRLPSDAELARFGAGLRRIRTSRVDVDWLQGPGPTDLYVWHTPAGALSHVELGFARRVVRLIGADLATGRTEEGAGSSYAQTELVELDAVLDLETALAARRILDAVPADLRSGPVSDLAKALTEATTPNP